MSMSSMSWLLMEYALAYVLLAYRELYADSRVGSRMIHVSCFHWPRSMSTGNAKESKLT